MLRYTIKFAVGPIKMAKFLTIKAVKPVWTKQLTRLPCHVVYVKFQFMYTTKIHP